MDRRLSLIDKRITQADRTLRAALGIGVVASTPSPAAAVGDGDMSERERCDAARLMRVNHAGEIAAQALYRGQAATARLPDVRGAMDRAAAEEIDHLAWCRERIDELGGRTSALDPLWYAGSFAIGALAGLAGDRWSLGFVAETERQVVRHIDDHLGRLPAGDSRSRSVLERMREDEERHGNHAREAGGADLPAPVRGLMNLTSKLMTRAAYYL